MAARNAYRPGARFDGDEPRSPYWPAVSSSQGAGANVVPPSEPKSRNPWAPWNATSHRLAWDVPAISHTRRSGPSGRLGRAASHSLVPQIIGTSVSGMSAVAGHVVGWYPSKTPSVAARREM